MLYWYKSTEIYEEDKGLVAPDDTESEVTGWLVVLCSTVYTVRPAGNDTFCYNYW